MTKESFIKGKILSIDEKVLVIGEDYLSYFYIAKSKILFRFDSLYDFRNNVFLRDKILWTNYKIIWRNLIIKYQVSANEVELFIIKIFSNYFNWEANINVPINWQLPWEMYV